MPFDLTRCHCRAAMRHRTLIAKLGGPGKVAGLLGLSPNTPCKWRTRGIPPEYWLALARAAREQGIKITAEDIERNSPLQRRLRPQVIPSLTHA